MEVLSDLLLALGALAATTYCYILGLRLKKFRNMEEGMGAAIAVLSAEVTEMSTALERANIAAKSSSSNLENTTLRAESAARRLELLIASLHDIPNINEKQPETSTAGSKPSFLRSGATQSKPSEAHAQV